ncbi:MAG: hypothetical protein JWO53_740 [Chlamydiia bacterium]|nr:hypothetical protein [Chlamydiia bacterium]
MPTYVYHCDSCNVEQEIVQKITEDALKTCPLCHKDALRRILPSSVAIQFKGSGFYINDYPSKGCKPNGCDCKE